MAEAITVTSAMRVIDPAWKKAERKEAPPQVVQAKKKATRITYYSPTYDSIFSLGQARKKGRWGGWAGTTHGITAATGADLFCASRGAAIVSGFHTHRKGVNNLHAVDLSRRIADEIVQIGDLAVAAQGLLDTVLHGAPDLGTALALGPAAGGVVGNVAGLVGTSMALAPDVGELDKGTIRLCASNKVFSTGKDITSAAYMNNTTMGALSATVVGGLAAGVHGMAAASLSSCSQVDVKGSSVAVTADVDTGIAAITGSVSVRGKQINVGDVKVVDKTINPLLRQKPTESLRLTGKVISQETDTSKAVNLTLDGKQGHAMLGANGSTLSLRKGAMHVLAGKFGLRLKDKDATLVHIPVVPDVNVLIAAAAAARDLAIAAAETAFKAANSSKRRVLVGVAGTLAGAVGGGILVGKLSGDQDIPFAGEGSTGIATLAGGAAIGAGLGAATLGTASIHAVAQKALAKTRNAAIAAARAAFDRAVRAARGSGPENTISLALALPTTPRVAIGSDNVKIKIGGTSVTVKNSEIAIDAGPMMGSVSVTAGMSSLKLTSSSVELDAGPGGTLKLAAGGNTCVLGMTGWKTPAGNEM